tara:strand:- start:44 stop:571 length:528 start_codon:yes stop_codon:yes gene_type:complete
MGKYKRRVFAWGYGHSSDLEVWEYLYEVAVRQIESEARKYGKSLSPETSGWKGEDLFNVDGFMLTKREAMNRFRAGAVQGLSTKLAQQQEQAKAEAQAEAKDAPTRTEAEETAITVQALDSRSKRADNYMREKNPKIGSGYRGGVGSSSAGVKAGRRMSINKGVGGGRGPKLLGC